MTLHATKQRELSSQQRKHPGQPPRFTPVCDRDALEASICRDSFYEFVQRFWHVVVQEEPVWNWHIKVLCDELQLVAENLFAGKPKLYDVVINIPPGTTKSTICSVMFPMWCWTRMPTCKCICSSYSFALALDLSRKSRDIVSSPKWARLFGVLGTREIRSDQNTKSYFVNTHGGYRFATSTGGTVTGFHGHFVIVDDPLDPTQAVSELELKAANHHCNVKLPSRKVNKEVSVELMIMQRLHQDDPSAAKLRKAAAAGVTIRHINLPAEIILGHKFTVCPRRYAKNYVNGLLDPTRLSREVLRVLLIEMGKYAYSGQMMQDPVPLGGGMFHVDRIHLEREAPRPIDFKRVVRYWDKAGTEGAGAYTVGVKMGIDNHGRYWVLNVCRGQWDSDVREDRILQCALADGREVSVEVEQEPGSGGKESAANTIKRLAAHGIRVRGDRPTGPKEVRADTFSVMVNIGNVYCVVADWNEEYLSELQFFPSSTYKDQVDASSGAYAMLTRPRLVVGGLGYSAKKGAGRG